MPRLFLKSLFLGLAAIVASAVDQELSGIRRNYNVRRLVGEDAPIITMDFDKDYGTFNLGEDDRCQFGLYQVESGLDISCTVTCDAVSGDGASFQMELLKIENEEEDVYDTVSQDITSCPLALTATTCAAGAAIPTIETLTGAEITNFGIKCTRSPAQTPSNECSTNCFDDIFGSFWGRLFGP